MKPFPIPVVAVGPGSQPEDETLDYLPMPQGMDTFLPPRLPEPEEMSEREGARRALHEALDQLAGVLRGGASRQVTLAGLPAADLRLLNQVLGEGEVSARVADAGRADGETRVQESVFAGVWRVVRTVGGRVVDDLIEVGAIPQVLKDAAREDVAGAPARWDGELPPEVQNAPLLLTELEDQWTRWRPGQPPHVVNLTLLPMSVQDIGFLDHHLGTGRVLILSRGYGNCRITNTRVPNCWRVVYYNSQDVVIQNLVEVTELPEVAQAAEDDLRDSHERLSEVLQWMAQA